MHYFHNLSSASGGFAHKPPPGLHPWTPLGDFRPQIHGLPTPGKNPAGAHGQASYQFSTDGGTAYSTAASRICNSESA